MKKYLGILGLLTVTIIWGGAFPACDMSLESLTPFQVLAIRFFIASVFMMIFARKDLKTIKKEEIKCGVLLGSALFAGFALQMVGLQYTTASKSAFLTSTNVVLVPFLALIIRHKRIETKNLIGVCMAIAGAGVLSLQSDFSIGFGDFLTLLCAVGFAFQIFLTSEYVDKIRPSILNFLQMSSACVLSTIGCIFEGKTSFQPTAKSMTAVIYLGIAATMLAYLLQTASQQYVDETRSAIILSMEAVFGTVFSVIILHEGINRKMLIGSSLILGAVLISEIKFKKQIKTAEI